MAIMAFSFDTLTKKLDASIDGKSVDNVVGIDIYRSYDEEDEHRCCITTATKDESTDIRTFTQVAASNTLQAKASKTAVPSQFEGFVEAKDTSKSQIHKDIAAAFGV